MNKIHSKLEKLADCFEAKDLYVRRHLLPPLSKEEILEQCSWFPYDLPSQIIDMYTWSGGCPDPLEAEFPFNLVDDAVFATIENAKLEYLSLQNIDEYEETCEAFGINLDSCFPLAKHPSWNMDSHSEHEFHKIWKKHNPGVEFLEDVE